MPKRTLVRPTKSTRDEGGLPPEPLPPEPGDNGTPRKAKSKCSSCGAKTRAMSPPANQTRVKDPDGLYAAYFSSTRWNTGSGWSRPWEIRGHKKNDAKRYNYYVTCVGTRAEAQRVVNKLAEVYKAAVREGEESALAQLTATPPQKAATVPPPKGTPGDLREAMRSVRSLRAQMGALRGKLEKEELAHAEDLRLLRDSRKETAALTLRTEGRVLGVDYASDEYQEKVQAAAAALVVEKGLAFTPDGDLMLSGPDRLPGTEGLVSSLAIPARVVAATAEAADTLATLMVDAPRVEAILFRRDEDGDPQCVGAVCTVQWFRKEPS